jgi:toxin ParE1/3/4
VQHRSKTKNVGTLPPLSSLNFLTVRLIFIWHFGALEWSSEQADRHLRDIDDMFERLREDPKLGHKRDDLIPNLRSILVRPHLIFYRQTPQRIKAQIVLASSARSGNLSASQFLFSLEAYKFLAHVWLILFRSFNRPCRCPPR